MRFSLRNNVLRRVVDSALTNGVVEDAECSNKEATCSIMDHTEVTTSEAFNRTNTLHHSRLGNESRSTLPSMGKTLEKVKSGKNLDKQESRWKKIMTRVCSSLLMINFFLGIVYMGHFYICGLIFVIEVLLFRELVTVRYNTFFHIIEETIPLFRTTQWMWFLTSIFYTYSDFGVEMIKSNIALHHLLMYAQLQAWLSFLLYSGTFVLTITTMQRDHIKFQLNQLCWTILVLCLTVGQLKYIMHNVYNGILWFLLPVMLVIANDTFAWLSGVTLGRKLIEKTFFLLSPNKTWEGFIGGWIGTMITGWKLSRFMANFTWMTCPTNQFGVVPLQIHCELDPMFQEVTINMDMLPKQLLTIETMTLYPVQIHALALSMFASFVAPFGGFLASAIKRAYGIKDFDSLIPGHGGIMDRMDCQFLMAACTWVHYNTFVKMAGISVPKMLYMYHLMNHGEQKEFFNIIASEAVSA